MQELLNDPALQEVIHQAIMLGALIFARLIAIVQFAPHLGGQALPQSVKLAIVLALMVLVYPTLWATDVLDALPSTPVAMTFCIFSELATGFTIGYITLLMFEAIRMTGQIVDNAAGLTMVDTFAPQLPERVSVSASFLFQLFVVIFFVSGAHLFFLKGILKSYENIPLNDTFWLSGQSEFLVFFLIRLTTDVITIAIMLAAPVMIAILLTNILLAIVNKAGPQINVFFLGMPLKALAALIVLVFGLHLVMEHALEEALVHMNLWMQWSPLHGAAP